MNSALIDVVGSMKEYIIRTERLGFSLWGEDDLAEALSLWRDPEVTKFISSNGRMSDAEIEKRMRVEIANWNDYKMQYWPLYIRTSDEFAGCCGSRPKDIKNGVLELGVHLRPQYWGKGFAWEACRAAIRYAFDVLDAKALFAGHNPNNVASARLLKVLGFKHTHDELYPPTGLMHPSYLLSPDELRKFDHGRSCD
jgi:ribosomal-protein-alanine N-acetyltransferase